MTVCLNLGCQFTGSVRVQSEVTQLVFRCMEPLNCHPGGLPGYYNFVVVSILSKVFLCIALVWSLLVATKILVSQFHSVQFRTYFFLDSDWSRWLGAETLFLLNYVTPFTIKTAHGAFLGQTTLDCQAAHELPSQSERQDNFGVLTHEVRCGEEYRRAGATVHHALYFL